MYDGRRNAVSIFNELRRRVVELTDGAPLSMSESFSAPSSGFGLPVMTGESPEEVGELSDLGSSILSVVTCE